MSQAPGAPRSTTGRVRGRDGLELLVRHWPASSRPWARALLVHGIAEHSGRYEHVGRQMAQAGLDVTAADLRGFGASDGRRAYVARWSDYHDDLQDRLAELRSADAGTPVALFGHSLGGLICLGYALEDRPQPDALLLSSPALLANLPRWKVRTIPLLARIAPKTSAANAFSGELLSRDPRVGDDYVSDPLNEHRTTTRLGAEILREQSRVRAAIAARTTMPMPTLVTHGSADRLVPTPASEPLGRLGNVSRRVYPGLRHETHNEPEGPEVIADDIGWLRATLGRP